MKDRSDEQLSLVIEEMRSRESCYPLLRSVWLAMQRIWQCRPASGWSPSVWLVSTKPQCHSSQFPFLHAYVCVYVQAKS